MRVRVRQPLPPDDPMYQQAVEAMKKYVQARSDDRPEAELERLRREAEYAFQSVNDYQLAALGGPSPTRHWQQMARCNRCPGESDLRYELDCHAFMGSLLI